MAASIVLREFEYAAYRASLINPDTPLLCYLNTIPGEPSSLTDENKLANQRTWKVFRACLIHLIGEKFLWICRRYQFDAQKMEEEGLPLLPKHVELFSIGASQVLARDVTRLSSLKRKIKDLTRQELLEKFKEAQAFHNVLGKQLDPKEIYATPSAFRAWFIHNPQLMDREKQILFSDAWILPFPAFLERLTKVVANKELMERQILPAPGSNGQLDFYRVYRKISTGHGLMAYALKPAAADSNLEPLLVFRCSQMALSQEDVFPSLFEDLEPKVATSGYTAAKPLFERLMKDPSFLAPGVKLKVAGYSIGGSHAQRFVSDYHNTISSASFYSAPSIDAQTVERFAREIHVSNRADTPLDISIYRVFKDFCHYAGEKHLGWGIDSPNATVRLIEIKHENRQLPALDLHALRFFDNTQVDYSTTLNVESSQELLNHLDNSRRGPEVIWYEKMRRIWGKVVYGYLYLLYGIVKGCENIFGIKILRSSRPLAYSTNANVS